MGHGALISPRIDEAGKLMLLLMKSYLRLHPKSFTNYKLFLRPISRKRLINYGGALDALGKLMVVHDAGVEFLGWALDWGIEVILVRYWFIEIGPYLLVVRTHWNQIGPYLIVLELNWSLFGFNRAQFNSNGLLASNKAQFESRTYPAKSRFRSNLFYIEPY